MTPEEIISRIATVLAGDMHPDGLVAIPVDSIPPEYRLAYDKIAADVREHGTANADRILSGANGQAEQLRGIFVELLDRAEKIPRPLFETVEDALNQATNQHWLVDGVIEIPSTGAIIGASGAGKSFVAGDLAACEATGSDWAGRPVTAGTVFYLAQEDRLGLLKRFRGWKKDRGLTAFPDNLFISTSRTEMDESGGRQIEDEVERLSKRAGGPPALIIADTVAKSLPSGADENSAADMGAFLNVVDRLRDRFGCVVLLVHHTGHIETRRARGSSSFKAALDFEICVSKKSGAHVMEWTKLKNGEEPPAQEFSIRKISLQGNEGEKPIKTAVISWRGVTARPIVSVLITKVETLAINTLRIAIVKGGEPSATVDSWRTAFTSGHWGENEEAIRKAFNRVRGSLVGKGLIRIVDGHYSLANLVPGLGEKDDGQ